MFWCCTVALITTSIWVKSFYWLVRALCALARPRMYFIRAPPTSAKTADYMCMLVASKQQIGDPTCKSVSNKLGLHFNELQSPKMYICDTDRTLLCVTSGHEVTWIVSSKLKKRKQQSVMIFVYRRMGVVNVSSVHYVHPSSEAPGILWTDYMYHQTAAAILLHSPPVYASPPLWCRAERRIRTVIVIAIMYIVCAYNMEKVTEKVIKI